MTVQIEVFSPDCVTRRIRAKDPDDRDFVFREQKAYMHVPGDPYPMACVLSLGEREPWPAGRYTLGGESYRIGRFGAPELVRELVLVPVPADAAKPVPARSVA